MKTVRKFSPPLPDPAAAIALKVAGETYATISAKFGVSEYLVAKACTESGLFAESNRLPNDREWTRAELKEACAKHLADLRREGICA